MITIIIVLLGILLAINLVNLIMLLIVLTKLRNRNAYGQTVNEACKYPVRIFSASKPW